MAKSDFMVLQEYHFDFPEELIAQAPLAERDASRMLCLSRRNGSLRHAQFRDLLEYLQPRDLLVANNTAVQSCRLFARKATGGLMELFVLSATTPLEHRVWLSPARGLKVGQRLGIFSRGEARMTEYEVEITSLEPDDFRIRFFSEIEQKASFAEFSEMPLPPYIARARPHDEDRARYQTVFASNPGACAAPTAGLHFTREMQARLLQRNIDWAELTLHVGPGTFLPVKTENIDEHVMHAEYYEIPAETCRTVQACWEKGGRVIAVGTTALRALESFAATGEARGWTRLFIRPGFEFQMVSGLLTNFHQPRSTLLMLISALAGREKILAAYQEAIRQRYRLFSYGDCMLIL